MKYDEFITQVQQQAGLPSREEAAQATEATLETLGERLYRTPRGDLASELPKELKEFLLKRQEPEPTNRQHTDRYTLQEFYNRVGARAETGYYDAAERAKAVMSVLRQAVSDGTIRSVLADLPDDYQKLFEDEPQGPGFPSLDTRPSP